MEAHRHGDVLAGQCMDQRDLVEGLQIAGAGSLGQVGVVVDQGPGSVAGEHHVVVVGADLDVVDLHGLCIDQADLVRAGVEHDRAAVVLGGDGHGGINANVRCQHVQLGDGDAADGVAGAVDHEDVGLSRRGSQLEKVGFGLRAQVGVVVGVVLGRSAVGGACPAAVPAVSVLRCLKGVVSAAAESQGGENEEMIHAHGAFLCRELL